MQLKLRWGQKEEIKQAPLPSAASARHLSVMRPASEVSAHDPLPQQNSDTQGYDEDQVRG